MNKKVIFICRKNIFRSQVAKGLCNKFSDGKILADSYGTEVDPREEGVAISQFHGMKDTISLLMKEGIDISNERCKQITPEALVGVDKIIIMAERESIPEWLNKYDFEYWDISYPPVLTSKEANKMIEDIKSKVSELIAVK